MAKRFFDEYDEFYGSSATSATSPRLNFRHHTIIEQNAHLLKGKRVVEIASHDGRWAFAALKAGAESVVGVEAREHLVDNANKVFARYEVPESQYTFICGDGFDEADRMIREGEQYDVAMVLGFLYHTARQYEIIYKMARLGVETMILDTAVLPNVTEPIVRVKMENTGREAQLYEHGKQVGLGGRASITALNIMIKAAGYQPSMVVPTIAPGKGCKDYRNGNRHTFLGTR